MKYICIIKINKTMSYISNVISGCCPNCKKTKVFETNRNPFLFRMPKMNQECKVCNYSFHRETGFYFGAMYMSYALTVAEMVAVFVIGLILGLSFLQMFIGVVIVVLLLSTFNYKMSRLMWLNIFYKKDEE